MGIASFRVRSSLKINFHHLIAPTDMNIFVILGFVLICFLGFYFFNEYQIRKNRPIKGQLFACSECGTSYKHDDRTINGYDKGVRKSFRCGICFANWQFRLKSARMGKSSSATTGSDANSSQGGTQPSSGNKAAAPAGAGCLGVTLMLIGGGFGLMCVAYQYFA